MLQLARGGGDVGLDQTGGLGLERALLDPGTFLLGIGEIELASGSAGFGFCGRDWIFRHDPLRNKPLCRQFKT